MKNKSLIIGILFVAIVAGVVYFIVSTRTEKWEMYRNDELGFEIQYPARYDAAATLLGASRDAVLFIDKSGQGMDFGGVVVKEITPNNKERAYQLMVFYKDQDKNIGTFTYSIDRNTLPSFAESKPELTNEQKQFISSFKFID